MSCIYMSIYKSPISGGQFVNQPPKRGAGERRLVATLAQQHQSAKYRHICCSKLENIILSNYQLN